MTRFRKAKHILWITAAALLFLGLWGFWWEPSSLTVVRPTIAVWPWHEEHSGLRVGVMSDLHVGSPHRSLAALKDIVAAMNAEKPDLVLLPGDFVIQGVVGGNFVSPELIAGELAGLQATLGVVAVLGNHDWWYDGDRIRRALEARGIRVLENENMPVTYQGRAFWLCGLADLWTRTERVEPTLAKIIDGEPVIAFTHNPDVFPRVPTRVSLTVAGHTHGGQVDLPIVGRLVVPSQFGQRYAYGFVQEGGRKLFVTSGVGTSILPVRFRVPPEIAVLTLVRRPG
jgi:uncharacterized protein